MFLSFVVIAPLRFVIKLFYNFSMHSTEQTACNKTHQLFVGKCVKVKFTSLLIGFKLKNFTCIEAVHAVRMNAEK